MPAVAITRAPNPVAICVRVAAVPRHEIRGRDAAGELLAGDVEATVARGAVGEDQAVVGRQELGHGHVGAVGGLTDLDPGHEAHLRPSEDVGQCVAHGPDREVVRCHAVAHETERHGQPVEPL